MDNTEFCGLCGTFIVNDTCPLCGEDPARAAALGACDVCGSTLQADGSCVPCKEASNGMG